jgi:hypothetical protein
MVNKMVHLRMSEKLYQTSKSVAEDFGFSNLQEFFRNSIQRAIEDYEQRMAIKRLKALQGSVKNAKKLTPRQKEQLIEEMIRERKRGYDIFKQVGL